MPLSAVAVSNAKPREKPYKLSDERGLFLLVTPKGHRYWRFKYRFDGKEKILAFGVYPDVSLADAREKRDAARKVVAAGEDPAANKKRAEAEKRARSQETFSIIADEWLDRLEKEGRSASTLSKLRWLTDFARPALGDRLIAEITAPELLEVLRKVEARGRYETANRLRSTFGTIFRYAIATSRAHRDVAYDLRGALITPKVSHRSAITDPKEVGALLRAIEGHEGQPAVRHGLRLLPHVFVRPGELRLAQWQEFDLEGRLWTIPADRTKMRRQHRVPLSSQAVGILRELKAITGDGSLLFPSILSAERAISDNTMNAALRRLGYDKSQMTAHGFRAMASTLLNETGRWHPDAIERQLAHVEGNGVRRAYARGEHWDERVRMMQFWSDYLDELRIGPKVVKGRFRRAA
ncbi:MAG TPA: integrase arm-type DNA-binding domain-containing protein [Allosphingosinicella sp.]|jgi:integrase